MPVQSILFNKKVVPYFDAISYLKENGFKYSKVDETTNYFRFRQFDPERYKKYAHDIGKSVKYTTRVVGPIEFVIAFLT